MVPNETQSEGCLYGKEECVSMRTGKRDPHLDATVETGLVHIPSDCSTPPTTLKLVRSSTQV